MCLFYEWLINGGSRSRSRSSSRSSRKNNYYNNVVISV